MAHRKSVKHECTQIVIIIGVARVRFVTKSYNRDFHEYLVFITNYLYKIDQHQINQQKTTP